MLSDLLRTPGDQMGPKERAWRVAGYAVLVDEDGDDAEVIAVGDELPVLSLPLALSRDEQSREYVFGWAMIELVSQRIGWLGLVRRLRSYTAPREMEEAG